MIVYVISADHSYTIGKYLQQWVRPAEARFIQVVFYEELPWRWLHLPATYVFTDIERLLPEEIAVAMDYALNLQRRGYRVLNLPGAVAKRLELQERLYKAGINPFRQWPRTKFRESRFPAFLRLANTHSGSIGDLIHDERELAERLESLPPKEQAAEDLILVEFCDTQDAQGRYHKYSSMRVGDVFVPRHVLTSLNWMLKAPDLLDAPALEIEREYVRNFTHRALLEKAFALAGIDYGRIDYSLQGGEARVWEINTNPTLMPSRRNLAEGRRELVEETNRMFLQALRSLDSTGPSRDPCHVAEWERVRARHHRVAFMCRLGRKIFGRKRA
jgi:hypothetical protein